MATHLGGSNVSWEEEQELNPGLLLPAEPPDHCQGNANHSSSEWLLYSLSDSNPVLNPSRVRTFLIYSSFIGKHLHFPHNCN